MRKIFVDIPLFSVLLVALSAIFGNEGLWFHVLMMGIMLNIGVLIGFGLRDIKVIEGGIEPTLKNLFEDKGYYSELSKKTE
ncbi:hypothetical protein [Pseudobacteriovorax antillogorgiicola]|uniref:Uncharacterized protein n=1 Tax=Pseudobacteriovorax antillogorgiicola TaxID=1513793 RepID=A0A1Y6CPR9_9BACT|nr:hypothetical protein [Pseudobacteriovorax antillogorgiicola]TCS51620.1 hypothetical protein EDD56_1104 [Pseudobacteriovorax antillogorgiicola]SMF81479.1 hypothetical protein SAMN06296036_1374 [Pseudobacteriovorax antillogorgiicola]